jgi:tetratricopeptide (TPR) repeat protein
MSNTAHNTHADSSAHSRGRNPRGIASLIVLAGSVALAGSVSLMGCQSLDNAAKLNKRREPAQVDPANSGRPPAILASGETTSASGQSAQGIPGQEAVGRGQQLLKQGNSEAALKEFERAIAINPKLTVAYLRAGDIYREQGDYTAAERRYGTAAQVEPASFDAQYLHGLALQLLNRYSDAVRAYIRALTINPRDFNANLNLATTYLQLGEPQQALAYAQRAVELDPKNSAARSNLGAAYSALDRHSEAVTEYLQALELAPLSGPLLLNLANSLGRAGRYEEMVNTLDQLTRTEPTAVAFERLGAGHFYLRKYPESLAAYRKAVEIDPNHFPAWNGIGVNLMNQWIFSDQRDEPARQEALEAWRRSVQIERNQPKIMELLGRYQR